MKQTSVDASLDTLNRSGNAIGQFVRSDGVQVGIEVPFALPGDVVKAKVWKKRRGNYLGMLEEVTNPSPLRIQPRCIHFGVCGGCRWQNMPYPEQLQTKQKIVLDLFKEFLTPDVVVHPAIPCYPLWGYRNKMEFSFSRDAMNRKFLGLIMDSSKGKVLNLSECHLVNPWFMEAIRTTRTWWDETSLDAYHPYKNTGSLRTLTLREGKRTGDRMVILTVSGNPDYAVHKKDLESLVAFLRDAIEPVNSQARLSIFLRIQQVAKGMSTNFYEMLLYGPDHLRESLDVSIDATVPPRRLTFNISPTAFFQPNTDRAEQLYSLALQAVGIDKNAIVYDLFCGTGTLGICAAEYAKQVVGIEISPEAVLDARTNAKLNGMENVTILSGAVRHLLSQIKEEKSYPLPDIVVIDPPRAGLEEEAIRGVLELEAKKILYISCNPATQAKDIAKMVKHGYRIVQMRCVDQFAHTPHIENFVVLERTR